jgi:hypothetical protein
MGWHNPRAFCWSRLTERRRAGLRLGSLIVLIAIVWWALTGTVLDKSIIHDLFTLFACGFMWYIMYVTTAGVVDRVHHRRFKRDRLDPLKKVLAPLLGQESHEVQLHLNQDVKR